MTRWPSSPTARSCGCLHRGATRKPSAKQARRRARTCRWPAQVASRLGGRGVYLRSRAGGSERRACARTASRACVLLHAHRPRARSGRADRSFAAWPRRREACACEALVKPVPVSRARSSSRLRPVGALLDPLTIECGPIDSGLVIGAKTAKANIHTGAASRHGSTTSTPPARCQPTLTRVALTCIYTAHTSHSRRRLPLATRIPSTAPVPQLTRFSSLRAALARQDLLVARRGRRDPWFVLPAS